MTAVSQFDINSNIIRINMIYSLDSRVSKSDEYNTVYIGFYDYGGIL